MPREKARVLVIQNSEVEHLGVIGASLARIDIEFDSLESYLGDTPPASLDAYNGLIVLGGPQSVYEESRYPFLRAEKNAVRSALRADKPVLGICLGSQILAEALGAIVRPGSAFELGWREVIASPQSRMDMVLQPLPQSFVPLHWHGDVFDLPPGASPLGASAQTPVQGFSWKSRFYGLLFHLEVTNDQVAAMVDEFPMDLMRGGLAPGELLADASDRTRALQSIAAEVFDRWCSLL